VFQIPIEPSDRSHRWWSESKNNDAND
jgi:hypothetical protein